MICTQKNNGTWLNEKKIAWFLLVDELNMEHDI